MALNTTLRLPTALNNFNRSKNCPSCYFRKLSCTSKTLQDRGRGEHKRRGWDPNRRESYKPMQDIRYPRPLFNDPNVPNVAELVKRYTPPVEREKTSVLLFPGQGSQFVGMGKELLRYPGVEDTYTDASEILGYDLLDVCINGPKSKLDMTLYSQPAVVVTSLAALKKLKTEHPQSFDNIRAVAGFSVGEITSLIMAGVLSFNDGIQLVKLRAEAMQEASKQEQGAMMTVFLGADSKLATALMASREFCRRKMDISEPVCDVAIHLSINVKVIAGHEPAIEFIKKYGKEWEIKDTKPLPVSGAFHTTLMKDTDNYRQFQRFLNQIEFQEPTMAIWACNDISLYNEDGYRTKKNIIRNYVMSVKWEQIVHKIIDKHPEEEHPNIYEVGPGKQLGWVIHKINKKAYQKYTNIQV